MNDSEDGRTDGDADDVDRRKFLVGVGLFGAGGVAGCLGDGDGGSPTPTGTGTVSPTPTTSPESATPTATTPTSTGTRTATDAPPTETATPVPPDAEFEPIPVDLTYEYHEGSFSSMPDFDGRSPTATGEADRITSEPADGPGAFRYTGTIPIGDRLEPGTYTLLAGTNLLSSGRLIVSLDGSPLSFSDGSTSVFMMQGDRELQVEYYQPSADGRISLGWRGTYGELLPPIAETDPVRRGKTRFEYELVVEGRAQGKMMQMPNSGSRYSQRSIAVALPTYTNYCFDMNTCSVRYAWRGAFLDYGPLSAYGEAAGDENGQPLGALYDVGTVEYPLRIADPGAEPDTEYRAFREAPHPAELQYTVDGTGVTEVVEGAPDGLGLRYTFRFEEAPDEPVYFLTAEGEKFERSASTGTWDGGTLEVPAGTGEFTATVVNARVSG